MSTELGTVGQADSTSVSTPTTGTQIPESWVQGLATVAGKPFSWMASLNPFNGESFLPNATLVGVGVVLALGALLISQKETIIKVSETAARVAA